MKTHEELIEEGQQKNTAYLDKKLEHLTVSYSEEKEKLDAMGNFVLGKTSPTEFRTILDQNEKVKALKVKITQLEQELKDPDSTFTYHDHDTPSGVVNELITAVQKQNFQKLKSLCDPYGENDSLTQELCWLEYNSEEEIDDISTKFATAKINTKPLQTDGKYIFNVQSETTGPPEITVTLINRDGKWYLFQLKNR